MLTEPWTVFTMFAYQMVFVLWHMHSPDRHLELHLLFALVIVYLSFARNRTGRMRIIYLLAAAAGLGIGSYLYIFSEALRGHQLFNLPHELVFGAVLILLCWLATWSTWGRVIAIVIALLTVYPIFGHYLPEPFYTTCYSLKQFLGYLSVTAGSGLHSRPLYISASFLFLFIVFGSILHGLGATRFFLEVGRWVGSKIRGGPAMMAVISSAGIGSINGSAVANANITGSFTIPMMKSAGYTSEQAGGIEAAASAGGQILPPVMGVVAFFMAGLTGIPYVKICAMATIPALLYFFNVGTYVYLNAAAQGISKIKELTVDWRELLLSTPAVIVPFGVIICLLVAGYSVLFVAFWAIVSTVITTAIRKKTRPSLDTYVNAFKDGAIRGAELAVLMAAVGLMMTSLTMSGLPIKLGAGIQLWSGGNITIALLIVFAVSIVMGLIGVELVGYIILSMFVITPFVQAGIPLETAHFFIIYAVAFGILTPPIALLPIVTSKMAGGNYWKTAIEAVKAGGPGLLLPFMFVFGPVLLLQPSGLVEAICTILCSIVMVLSGQIALTGYCMVPTLKWIRIIFILICVASIVSVFTTNYLLSSAALAGFSLVIIYQWRHRAFQKRREAM